jgi:hypothetical protein
MPTRWSRLEPRAHHQRGEVRCVLRDRQLDIVPQQVRVIRHERVKYACPCCDGSLRPTLAVAECQVRVLHAGREVAHHAQGSLRQSTHSRTRAGLTPRRFSSASQGALQVGEGGEGGVR